LVRFADNALRAGPKKFAEPVSLSSTASADFRLPATAFGFGFDLLALCARRKWESRDVETEGQGVSKGRGRNLRIFHFSTFPQPFLQLVERSVDRSDAHAYGMKKLPQFRRLHERRP
jgi:hypothetical protein